MLILFALTIFGCRGSFIYKNRPITISNAGKYTTNPNEISLVINTPFSLIRTAHLEDLQIINDFPQSDIENVYPLLKQFNNKELNRKNVVIIILESMGSEYYKFYNKDIQEYSGYTPFLDSLLEKSYTSYNCFTNGRKSIDAIPAVLASIPAVQFNFSLSKYCTNKIAGIGQLLQKEGYSTSFYHGAPNGSMGFESMAKLCGIDNYFGMNEYGTRKDFDGLWGIWDHKFLEFYAEGLEEMEEPFISSIFTITSHHPYKIPKSHEKMFASEENEHPMYSCVKYTDHALKIFFHKIKKSSWYNNTLFVITADHTNYSRIDKYKSNTGIFRVPIIFFDPKNPELEGVTNKVIQHTDILPSILYYLGYNKPFIAFGENIFSKDTTVRFAINYNNNFQLISDKYIFIYDPENKKITNVFLNNQKKIKKNILDKVNKQELIIAENRIKGFIQQYNNRMITNNLICK